MPFHLQHFHNTLISRGKKTTSRVKDGFAEVKSGIDTSLSSIEAISKSIGMMDEARINVVDVPYFILLSFKSQAISRLYFENAHGAFQEAISKSIGMMDEARINVVDVVQNLTAIAEENAAGTEETSASATDSLDCSASFCIWDATTAKPRPWSPALAASMEAFKDSRLGKTEPAQG